MKYLWTEDAGAGFHFWQLLNQLVFNNMFCVESKQSNQGILDALSELKIEENDQYYIAFDYVLDNQDVRNKYRMLRHMADKSKGKITILDIICFEHLILTFDKLVRWTGTGKKDKIKFRDEILSAIENHHINLEKIDNDNVLRYLTGFKRYSTERIIKSLTGELTENESWSVKGSLLGECWYKDCCVSVDANNVRCGHPEAEVGIEKMRSLFESEEIKKLVDVLTE